MEPEDLKVLNAVAEDVDDVQQPAPRHKMAHTHWSILPISHAAWRKILGIPLPLCMVRSYTL